MNKYLLKLAYDMDVDSKHSYGIAANRMITNPHVHDMLMEAAKHKDLHVQVIPPNGKIYSSRKPGFNEAMADIRKNLRPKLSKNEYKKTQTMDWQRDHYWSIEMDKNSPRLSGYKTDEGKKHAILSMLYRYHNI